MTRMLKRALEGVLSRRECDELFSAFDQVGKIIVVRIPDSLLARKRVIGETLLDRVKTAESVFCQSSDVGGDFRTRSMELLAGADSTETEYREHGCRFVVDVQEAFFSPRLSTERLRIASLTQDSDVIVNMFGGVGMFSIIAAKGKKCTVYSIDINPKASELCERNIALNKLAGSVISINGDAAETVRERLQDASTRTLMLLPEESDRFLDSAISATRNNGVIHFYAHTGSERKTEAPKAAEAHFARVCPVDHAILNARNVRAVGPRYYQTVVDARISKRSVAGAD